MKRIDSLTVEVSISRIANAKATRAGERQGASRRFRWAQAPTASALSLTRSDSLGSRLKNGSQKLLQACSLALLFVLITSGYALAQETSNVDQIEFGNDKSEKVHALKIKSGKVIKGALKTKARQLLPPESENWRGGRMTFRMRVDPERPNYFTAKFWGSEVTGEHGRLMLYLQGKQIGQRHLGEVDPLDISESSARFRGRFFFKTLPLPIHMTRGKKTLEFAIEAQGPIWGYGDTFERYQRAMKEPSRGIYRAYVHTDPCFVPAPDDPTGKAISFPVRTEPGEEVFKEIETRINRSIQKAIKSDKPEGLEGIRFLANAYLVSWTDAFKQKKVLNKVVRSIDQYYQKYSKDPEVVQKEWVGAGKAADAVRLLAEPIANYLDHKIEGTTVVRREAWAKLFAHSRDWHARHRRGYTNQTMIVDINVYRCNRALAVLNSKDAWPEKKAIRILHEAAGVEPWSGSLDSSKGNTWKLGKRYFQLTKAGLTKELGFVGAYGEIVVGFTRDMYDASRPTPDAEGDPKLKEQLAKIAKARVMFRYPLPDDEGFKSMRTEGVVGWRDWHYPGRVTYGQMPTGEGAPLDVAAVTLDPTMIGCGQQMIKDNQFFSTLRKLNERRGYEVLNCLMRVPENYRIVSEHPNVETNMPMSPDQPDFVFGDPEIGVVAVKNGDEILYASLYWRARYAVNFLARVHYLTPTMERDATVNIATWFKESGKFHEIRNRTNTGFNGAYEEHYQDGGMKLAMAGQKQPIAEIPSGVKDFKAGKENRFAGKGDVYLMYYGPYCVAMNCHKSRTFTLQLPKEFRGSKNVATGKIQTKGKVRVKPGDTLVLFNQDESQIRP